MPPDEAGALLSLRMVLPASEHGVFAGVVVPLLRSVVNKEAMRTSMLLLRCFVILSLRCDAAYVALEAAGYDKMEVRISETGWASASTDNETGATIQNARTYNFNLRKRLFKKKGTPLRPKIVVKAYIFALFNEDKKPNANSEQHYGLFEPNGSIAYDIGYSGLKFSSASPTHLTLKDIYARDWLSAYNMVLTCFVAVVLALTI